MKARIRVGITNFYDIEIDSDEFGEDNFDEIDLEEAAEDYERLHRTPDESEYTTPRVMVDGRWQEPILALKRGWEDLPNSESWEYRLGFERYATINDALRAKAVVPPGD